MIDIYRLIRTPQDGLFVTNILRLDQFIPVHHTDRHIKWWTGRIAADRYQMAGGKRNCN